jgi:hypothetical protein
MLVGDPVMFSGRLKTLSGLAGNQNLPFMDGHELWLEEAAALVSGFIRSSPGLVNPAAGLSSYIHPKQSGDGDPIHFKARPKNDDR